MDCRDYLKTVDKDAFLDYFRREKFCEVIVVVQDDRRETSFVDFESSSQNVSSDSTVGTSIAIRVEPVHDDVAQFMNPPTEQLLGSSGDETLKESTVENDSLHTSIATNLSIDIGEHGPVFTGTSTPLSQSRVIHAPERTHLWSKPCHKIILARNSAYFERLFEQTAALELAQHQQGQRPIHQSEKATVSITQRKGRRFLKVELKNITASSLEIILNFIYKGEFTFDHATFGTVLEQAQILKFDGVVQFCQDFLNQPLRCSNCVQILLCSKSARQQQVYENSFQFLSQNFSRACEESPHEWILAIPYEDVQALLKSTCLVVESEEDIFQLLISWVEHDVDSRSQHLLDLMKPRIHFLSAEFLLNILAKSQVVRDIKDCLLLITDTAGTKIIPPQEKRRKSASSTGSANSKLSFGSSVSRSSNSNFDNSASQSVEEETVCVFGSDGIHELLDPVKWEWRNWEKSILGPSFEVVMVQDSLLVVVSGWKDGEVSSRVEIYNFTSKNWVKGPSLNRGRDDFAACATGFNLVYVVGGNTSFTGKKGIDSCEMLDYTRSDTIDHREIAWKEIPPMNLKKWRCKTAAVDDRVFVIGGQTGSGESVRVFADTEKFHNNQWSFCSPMKEPRTNFAIATLGDKIYVCGGWRNMINISSCEKYDIEQNVWEPISNLRIPRQSCCASAYGNKILVIGCYDGSGWTNCTELYNPVSKKWSKGPSLVNNQKRPKCAKINRKFLED